MKPGASDYVGHYVRAVYDFQTTHPREINLQKGDIIKVTKSVDNNWLHGESRASEGNFPSSFVEKVVIPVGHGQKVFAAIENFPAQQDGDLEFRKGMVIEGLEPIDANWWRGKIGSVSGIFPITHVMELEVPKNLRDRASSVHSSEPMFARALCDSAAQLDEELGFLAGDIVLVTEVIDDDWYYGELNNKKGMFLSACVELIQDTPGSEPIKGSVIKTPENDSQVKEQQSVSDYNMRGQNLGYESENYGDVNANVTMHNSTDFSTGSPKTHEYNTQFSYTNENTKSLESSISPYGMTLYPFYGESSNELSFNENEIVYLIQHVDPQWIEGQIDDKIGIFPASYVSIVVDCPYAYDTDNIDNTESESTINNFESESAINKFETESAINNSECEITKNNFENESTQNKSEGESLSTNLESESRQDNFCAENSSIGIPEELPHPCKYGLVLYDFTGEVEGDLAVFMGETVEIVKNVDDNWVQARNDQGRIGMIPKQFLDIVSDNSDLPPGGEVKPSTPESKLHSRDCVSVQDNTMPIGDKSLKNGEISQSVQSKHSIVEEKSNLKKLSQPNVDSTAFKKPALPSKPKPILAQKPILKPKPISSQNKPNGLTSVKTSDISTTKSLTFEGQEVKTTSVNTAESQFSASKTPQNLSQIGQKSSKDTAKAFGDIDSIVKSEMRRSIGRSDTLPWQQKTENNGMKDLNRSTSVSSNIDKSSRVNNKRHSVNFPLTNSSLNISTSNVSQQNSEKTCFDGKETKVGHSTFFTDLSPNQSSYVRPVPMRKPPPPPQKTEDVDFTRKPSLRKPPPPRPSVPKDRPISPPRTSAVTSPKSKKSQKALKDQAKAPRQHIKPTRPAPQRPVPGQVATRPRAVPSRPPVRPPTADNLMSFSQSEEHEDTNIEIIEDLKQRIKEVETDLQRLFDKKKDCYKDMVVKYKKCKNELEFGQKSNGSDSETHDNIEFYTANIEGLTVELESLKENLHKVLPSSELDEVAKQMAEEEKRQEEEKRREEDKKRAEEERRKRRDKREKVIEELIQTERDFLHGLHLCIQTFICTTDKHPDVEIEAVFGNIEDVADVSQRLLTLLENAVNGKDFEEQLLGPCFTQLCEDMKNAYAPYCRNHDEVIAVLEKYNEDPSIKQYFDKKVNELREKIVVFDLEALLIKPVQRILKYPLLLNELIKSTEDSHKDKLEILNGINAMTDVATAINEYKRRKDLVYKYKRGTDQSLGDMLSKMTLHSLRKKGSRFKGRLSTNLGITIQTKDEDFDKVEAKFSEMEKTVKLFARDVQAYVDQLQEAHSCHECVVLDLVEYYDDKSCPEVKQYQKLYQVIDKKYLAEFTSTVTEVVIAPLNKLIVLFNGPNKVIQKRFDKLLDYDSMQRKEEKGSEKSLQEAKSNYLALNAQLLDELPKMYSLSFKLLQDCVCTFIRSQREFYCRIMDSMTEILNMSLLIDGEGTVVDNFNIKHTTMIDKMSALRIIPRGFNPKLETLGKPVVGKATDKKSKRMSLQESVFYTRSVSSAEQSDSQRVYVQQKYPADKVFRVTQTYQASEMMDLSVQEGSYVGLVMDKDPMGNKDRWFIDNGATKGFVPKTVLTLLNTATSNNSNMYPSIDSDVTCVPIGQNSPQQQTSPKVCVSDYSIGENPANDNEDDLDFALDEDMSPNISAEEAFYYAAYEFEARNSNELTLFEGQVVSVLNKHDQENNPEWWFVDADGTKGYAPANYLKPMG